jgi:hypothetical protein
MAIGIFTDKTHPPSNEELRENVGKVLRDTPQFHDGRWLFIPVTTERDVEDIKQLILLKKRPIKPK